MAEGRSGNQEAVEVSGHSLVLLVMALAVVGSLMLSRVVRVPYPAFLVLAGLVIGLTPGTPDPKLDPEIVFLGFLPPLVYMAAFLASPRELYALRRPVGFLSVGLVLVTIGSVAAVIHVLVPDLGWAAALVLGAVVAPTDPIAATAVLERFGGPSRLSTVLEGESLVNDAVALVAFGVALEAVGAPVTAPHVALRLVEVAVGGVAIGVAIGWGVAHLRKRLDDAPIEIAVSLVTPYAAYLPAERIHTSGVLAVVACGLYLGWSSPGLFLPRTRLQANAFWVLFAFVLNSILFVLVGLEFEHVLDTIGGVPAGRLAGYALAVCATVVGVRLLLVFAVPALTRFLGSGPKLLRERLVVGWSGMRGAISLAAALAIPLSVGGEAFPHRSLFIFLTFCVILATLVFQGTTLGPLVALLGIETPPEEHRHEVEARLAIARAALERLEEIATRKQVDREALDSLRDVYELRERRLEKQLEGEEHVDDAPVETARAVRREIVAAERERLLELRERGEVGEAAVREIQRELDLEDARVGKPS